MRLKLYRIWLAAVLGISLLAGCERASLRPHPQDPLLISKKPIESKAQDGKPIALAYNEPEAPAIPATALASMPSNTSIAGADPERVRYRPDLVTFGKPVPASELNAVQSAPQPGAREPASPKTVPVFPAVRSSSSELPAVTAQRREVSGSYGHAADYTWLQGILDKNFHGHFSLRYCDAAVDDQWGGKVHLEDDPRLAQFKEGDVVMVEGEIVRENGQPVRGAWNHYPRYHIRSVKLIQPKD